MKQIPLLRVSSLFSRILVAIAIFGAFLNQSGFAANGTALYLTVANPNGGSYDQNGSFWATTESGTGAAFVTSDQMTFGTNGPDANYPPGTAFTVPWDGGNNVNGLVVNTTNATITINGTANTHLNAAQNWIISNYSTVIVDDARQQFDALATIKGINWNNETVSFTGGGAVTFETPMGCNTGTAVITNNGIILNFDMSPIANPSSDAGSYAGGFMQNSGTLNFASAGSAFQFYGFTSGKLFTINGGTIDNTSGSAITLNWAGGGGMAIGGNFAFAGSTASLNLGTAPVTLSKSATITVTNNTLEADGAISGAFGLVQNGAGTLKLGGASTYTGSTVAEAGTLALTGSGSISRSSPLIVSNATLDLSGLTAPFLTNSVVILTNTTVVFSVPQTATTNIAAVSLDLGGTTNIINIASLPGIFSYPAEYHLFSYTTLNGANNFGLGNLPASSIPFVGYVTNVNNFEDLVILSGPPPVRQLTWTGTDPTNPNNWDVGTSLNWQTNGVATTYDQQGGNENDFVTFDDTATGQTNISFTTVLTPDGLTINNNTLIYNLGNAGSGGGSIGGPVNLTKKGNGLVILDDSGGNTFTGGVTISAGTLQVGNGDNSGSLGGGPVVNNGSLVFDHSFNDSTGVTNNISGTGTLTQEGGDTLRLSGNNTLAGPINVVSNTVASSGSTLQLGSSGALGTATTTVGVNCKLDLNGFTGGGIVKIGNSTIDNTSSTIPGSNLGLTNVTLTANATVATTGNRWDLRSPGADSGNPATATLSTGGLPLNLTKTGTGGQGFFGIVSAAVDPNLANIDIQGGTLDLEGNTTGLGNPADTLTVEGASTSASAVFELFAATNHLNKVIIVNDGGEILNGSGNNTIVGPVTFTNSSGGATPDCNVDVASGTSLTLSGALTGTGIIDLTTGTGTLNLTGNGSNFAGGVNISSGTLTISANTLLANALGVTMSGGTLSVSGAISGGGVTNTASTATVSGTGVISNTLDTTGIVSPAGPSTAGTLTVGGLVLESGAQLNVDLNFNNTIGSGTNDLLVVNGNLTANGNAINVNPLGILQDGVPYTVMTYTGTLNTNGLAFSANGVDGYNFVVDTSTPGQVNIIASAGPPVWNGGSLVDSDWSDSTNWGGVTITGGDNLFFAGVNRLNSTNDTTPGTQYNNIEFVAGAGAFTLNGNLIALGSTNILNNSSSTQTINLPLLYSSAQTFNGANGPLAVAGGLTNTGSGVEITTFSGTGTLVDLLGTAQASGTNVLAITGTNANWTLLDNPFSTPISLPCPIEVTNGTFNFGSATSAPVFTNTSPNGAPQDMQVGYVAGTATLNFSNGTFNTFERINTGVGNGATGIVSVVNGTVIIGSQFQGANATGGSSIFNASGGSVTIGTVQTNGPFYVSSRGPGTLNVSGTAALSCSTLDVSRSISTNIAGLVNLTGGSITVSNVGTATANATATATGSTGTFNFNGGVLRASANSPAFFTNNVVSPLVPLSAVVKVGGAFIDSSNFVLGFGEALSHDSTLTGKDGGLTKLGSGTLILTGTNTYNGDTRVSAGTLTLAGLSSIAKTTNIIIAGGATFDVSQLTSSFALGSSQIVTNSGSTATIGGNFSTGSGTLSLTYAAGTPSLSSSNGTLTLAGGTALTINNTGPALAAGTFTIIASASGGSVAGTVPSSFTVTGGGISAGATSSLQISGGALDLVVAFSGTPPAPTIQHITMSGGSIIVTGTNNTGTSGTYHVLTSTNVALPLTSWTVLTNGSFDSSGNFAFTNVLGTNPRQFYILQEP